ncbi:MAG TPA: methyltransferase [Rubrobacteraceae bacterium]|nr:methyltransferase [Rubrobacteraceae bacterium]
MTAEELSLRDTLWRITNGYQVSQTIHVVATLGIADLLTDGPRSADELAEATEAHAPALYRVLRALASIGVFVEQGDGCFALTPLAEYLRTDVPGSLRSWAMLIGRPCHFTSWGHLMHSVKTGEPAFPEVYGTTAWEYRATHPEESEIFDAAMTGLSLAEAEAVVRSYDFSGTGALVDVGGGKGTLLAAILAANPALRGILFDQPHVVADAKDLLERAGVADRCEVVSGSFFEAVPEGADAYLLKSIIHDWDDAAAIEILRKCRAAMADTARLLLVERGIRPANESDPAKFIDLMMLVMLGGRERTAEEYERLYPEAGFKLTNIIPTGSLLDIIEGVPV